MSNAVADHNTAADLESLIQETLLPEYIEARKVHFWIEEFFNVTEEESVQAFQQMWDSMPDAYMCLDLDTLKGVYKRTFGNLCSAKTTVADLQKFVEAVINA